MAKYVFLSDEWFVEVQRVVEYHGTDTTLVADVVLNVLVTGTPFGADRAVHLWSEAGRGSFGEGHRADADLTLTTDYETAREIFVSGAPGAGLQAFMEGKVAIKGDLAKLMAAGSGGPLGAGDLATALQAVTE